MALFFETFETQTPLRNFDLITTDVHWFQAWEVRISLERENSCTWEIESLNVSSFLLFFSSHVSAIIPSKHTDELILLIGEYNISCVCQTVTFVGVKTLQRYTSTYKYFTCVRAWRVHTSLKRQPSYSWEIKAFSCLLSSLFLQFVALFWPLLVI